MTVELDAKRDRAIGALVGLAVGDAIGTTLEFKRRDEQPPIADMVGGGPFRLHAGEWTDDTSQALCLADSLIATGGLDQGDLIERFYRWAKEGYNSVNGRCFDIGNTTRKALTKYKQTGIVQAGDDDEFSAGNGSLMRLSPVAIRWHSDVAEAREAAFLQSEVTHRAPEALAACEYFAEILVDAINGAEKADVLAPRKMPHAHGVAKVAAGSWIGKSRDEIRSSGYVVDTLEAALWAVAKNDSFADAVLAAANLADDADTVAAVTGQLAGALWGHDAIPDSWRRRLAWHDVIVEKADRLYDMAAVS
jgi:ADP-ribosyl-[dinitrogen reductase] hydrolase